MTDDVEIKNKLKALRTVTKKIDARVEQVPELEKQVTDYREGYYRQGYIRDSTLRPQVSLQGRQELHRQRLQIRKRSIGDAYKPCG